MGEVRIGVLAVQGSFKEHLAALQRCGVEAWEVRQPSDLAGLQGLIIPGGESTTMAKVAERNGLMDSLRSFREADLPVWGTCAGLIFLADNAFGQKDGGQLLLGGLHCTAHRNFFGSQLNSFEAQLPVPPSLASSNSPSTFRAVFIRAPAVVAVGEGVEILSQVLVERTKEGDLELVSEPSTVQRESGGRSFEEVVVAVRQQHLLATAFHPELTSDLRWHKLFIEMVKSHQASYTEVNKLDGVTDKMIRTHGVGHLPVFAGGLHLRIEERR